MPFWLRTQGDGWVVARDSRVTNSRTGDRAPNDVMGKFKISVGKDERGEYISYYDLWDFGRPQGQFKKVVELSEGVLGKPYEIYDRVYFDRATWTVSAPNALND